MQLDYETLLPHRVESLFEINEKADYSEVVLYVRFYAEIQSIKIPDVTYYNAVIILVSIVTEPLTMSIYNTDL